MAVVDGVQIHFVIGGHGDLVVLLHGWPEICIYIASQDTSS